jgi:hypothetical protein
MLSETRLKSFEKSKRAQLRYARLMIVAITNYRKYEEPLIIKQLQLLATSILKHN